jgi:phosphotriesterase-related protein
MAEVNTVLGPIATEDLGFTLMHEHLMVGFPKAVDEFPEVFIPNLLDYVVQGLERVKKGGVDTVVDMTTPDLGRDINFISEASKRSGVNVIACSGWWLDVPRFINGSAGRVTPSQMADAFAREVDKGIGDTAIKAGILKAASDMAGVTPAQEIMLRAVARAHLKTGVPIAIHSYHPGQVARQQIDILQDEGVDLRHVKVDHSNDTTDIEYLTWILEQGCYLGLDRYPGRLVSPRARTRTLKTLIDAGYLNKLCPSHDCSLGYVLPEGMTTEEYEVNNPHRYLYLKHVVFKWLEEMGLSLETINQLCITGPRHFFEGKS